MRRASNLLRRSKNGEAVAEAGPLAEEEGQSGAKPMRDILAEALQDVRVEDAMTPRADIVALEINATLDEVLEVFRDTQLSRLPVYNDTLDDPIGVVHLKDIALSHGFGASAGEFSLANHLKSITVVPESMLAHVLLQKMQASRRHMALVADEYGGIDGLVTIEDIIEEIVGEIDDEHDDQERPMWRREPSGAFLADARTEIDAFSEATGAELLAGELEEEEADTLGGLVFMLAGKVPEPKDVLRHPAGHEFEVLEADARRIKRLRVRLRHSVDEAPAARPSPASTGERGDASKDPVGANGAEEPRLGDLTSSEEAFSAPDETAPGRVETETPDPVDPAPLAADATSEPPLAASRRAASG
ncbi:MAG: transporter associated domain-containing protein [Pseudomonadota bacterium]